MLALLQSPLRILDIITGHRSETVDNASLTSAVVEVEEACSKMSPKNSETSSHSEAPVPSSTYSDALANVDDINIPEIVVKFHSTSVVVHMNSPQNEIKMLDMKERSSGTSNEIDGDTKKE